MRFRKVKSLINESHISRCLILEAKEDIQKFVDKFGEENYELFKNSNQRLKNAGLSTDILWYVKNIDKDELEDILSKLQRRLKVDMNDYVGNQENNGTKQSSDSIRGKYKYLGEKNGCKVYQPLDYLSSMDLGYMTGWCTAGRYGHAGEKNFKPSSSAAKRHFNEYTRRGVSFYYFLDSKTMEGLYAVALLPEIVRVNKIIGNYYIQQADIEIYNQADELDYSIAHELPLDLIPSKIVLDVAQEKDGLFIKDKILLKADPSLTEVKIPSTVTSIGESAFSGCENLVGDLIIPNSVTTIGNYAFEECYRLTSVEIGNNVTTIGNHAFYFCSSLTSVVIPNSVTTIGESAFSNCRRLTSVEIPSTVTSIGDYAFGNCYGLTSIEIPNGVKSIEDQAFRYCSSLTRINIPNSVTKIESFVFAECSSLTNIIIPDSVTTIGAYAFEFTGLSELVIPDSVTTIEEGAFSDCKYLTSVIIPDSVTTIGNDVFLGSEQLVIECHKGSSAEEYAKKNKIPVKYL